MVDMLTKHSPVDNGHIDVKVGGHSKNARMHHQRLFLRTWIMKLRAVNLEDLFLRPLHCTSRHANAGHEVGDAVVGQ